MTGINIALLGLADVLSSSKLLDYNPDEICLIGIQPAIIDTGLELSEVLNSHFEEIEEVVLENLQSWAVSYSKI